MSHEVADVMCMVWYSAVVLLCVGIVSGMAGMFTLLGYAAGALWNVFYRVMSRYDLVHVDTVACT